MTVDLFEPMGIDAAVGALEKDLTAPTGPSISTMRNHNFAILLYPPAKEFQLRQRVRRMTGRLESEGWGVLSIALHQLVFDRLRADLGDDLNHFIEKERGAFRKGTDRALTFLQELIEPHVEQLANDVAERIDALKRNFPDAGDRTLVLLGRAGALYPFFRSSALLKQIGGKTQNVPVVLLYPGERRGGGLSFMQELATDRDYRPRIYA